MKTHKENENKKKQKDAKEEIIGLLKKLKNAHEKYEEIQEIISNLESILQETKPSVIYLEDEPNHYLIFSQGTISSASMRPHCPTLSQ